jgi:hypothetical protein
LRRIIKERVDGLIGFVLFGLSFLLYLRTLAPSVVAIFDDSLEFQLVTYKLGIAHPTGYPLYTLLGKLFTLLPIGDVAYRVNLMSATFGALTVALLYGALALLLPYRLPAALGALTLAVSPVFWSQSLVAEVYTLNSAFVALLLFLLLRWQREVERGQGERGLEALALTYGLSLTHHRTMLLWAPAIFAFIWMVDKRPFERGREVAKYLLLFLAPLSLYLYLPLRGIYTSSLDGAYVNTLEGFIRQVTAGGYTIFLTENPLEQTRHAAFYLSLFQAQFGLAGLVLGAGGLLWLLRRPKVSLLLLLALGANLLFLLGYRVPDIEVLFIPLFIIVALWIGDGFALLWEGLVALGERAHLLQKAWGQRVGYALLLIVGGLLPLHLLRGNYDLLDRSQEWAVRDYGLDLLSQPLEEDGVIVGILGEMTLLRYFQETQGVRPHLTTIAADREAERLAAVERELEAGRPVYLTRPLPGAEERWHLSALGPLIKVQRKALRRVPSPQIEADISLADSLLLKGYDQALLERPSGRLLRVTLYWRALAKMEEYRVSLRLVDGEGHLAGQVDSGPVHFAYPTTAWRPQEWVIDVYDLPILVGVPPGEYGLNLVLYRPEGLEEVGRAQLGKVEIPRSRLLPDEDSWGVERVAEVNFGSRLRLLGYSVGGQEFKPGESIPLTFLWQTLKPLEEASLSLWVEDQEGRRWGERLSPLGGGYPPSNWERGEVVRDGQRLLLPAELPPGRYRIRMEVREGGHPLPRLWWLLPIGSTQELATVEVKERERSFTVPPITHPLDLRFGDLARFLGYDLEAEAKPGGRLRLTLYWQALSTTDTSYMVFVHLLDARGEILAQGDSLPGQGSLPTTGWMAQEVIVDRHEISLPADLASGSYTLMVGLYDPLSGERLPAYHEEGQPVGDKANLGPVEVSP